MQYHTITKIMLKCIKYNLLWINMCVLVLQYKIFCVREITSIKLEFAYKKLNY